MTRSLLILFLLITAIPSFGQNIAGTYRGNLPCADCSGIEETLILKCKAPCHSGRYVRRDKYLDTPDGDVSNEHMGKWRLIPNITGGLDTLHFDYDKPSIASWSVFSDKNTLKPLDKDKQPIEAPVDMSLRKKR